jgi:hypothetical protein
MRFIILIVVALVMAFVMFGRNPIKELQQQELERRKKYGADPVTQQTNMYIEQHKYQSGAGVLPRSNSVAAPDGTIPDAGDNVMVKTTSDGVVINPPLKDNSSQEVPQILPSSPTGSYYPPIIGGASPKTIQDNAIADSSKLRSGQQLSFDGMNVYAVDKAGNKTPLPDGNYTLYDGSEIVVHGGRRILNSMSN